MTQKTKRTIYVFSFTFLGVLIGFLGHMLIELWYIKHLLIDFEKYSLGFSWADLFYWHKVLTSALMFVFGVLGLWAGEYWWKQIYVLKRYPKKWAKYFER